MSELNQLLVPAAAPRAIEIDDSCHSVYVRFKTTKVQRTISDDRQGTVIAVDLDAKGEIVGVELVGVEEVSISGIRRLLPNPLKRVNFENANFVITPRHAAIPA